MEKRLGINLWDDYCDDAYLNKGEYQDTYMYVESEATISLCNAVLAYVDLWIKDFADMSYETELVWYDSAVRYPQHLVIGKEDNFYKRWQLNFKNLSHQRRENLIEELQEADLSFNGYKLDFYSES